MLLGRGGFIVELNQTGPSQTVPVGPDSATISFMTLNTSDELSSVHMEVLVVQMMFLRTYANAGVVEVSLCGKPQRKYSNLLFCHLLLNTYRNNFECIMG